MVSPQAGKPDNDVLQLPCKLGHRLMHFLSNPHLAKGLPQSLTGVVFFYFSERRKISYLDRDLVLISFLSELKETILCSKF
jgi:hypothetical protein